jgi:hypothetical protein
MSEEGAEKVGATSEAYLSGFKPQNKTGRLRQPFDLAQGWL